MKNHVTTKHTIQICKVCSIGFKSSIELINHVAKEHHKEDELSGIESKDIQKLDVNEAAYFVSCDSMSDKIV